MSILKLLGSGTMVLALGLFGAGAYASTAENVTTGPNSENEAMVEVTNDLDIDVDNDADFDANLTLDLNTGGNVVTTNTEAGHNMSGSATVNISGSTTIDQSGGCPCEDLAAAMGGNDHTARNDTTGPGSTNTATVEETNTVDVDVDNDADVDLTLDATVNTGWNETSNNTTAGNTESGDISFTFSWTTTINQGSGTADGE